MVDVFPVDWISGDVDGKYLITVVGKTPDGTSLAAHIEFPPFCYVAMKPLATYHECNAHLQKYLTKTKALRQFSAVVKRKSIWGFSNGAQRPFLQLAYRTSKDLHYAKYAFKRDGLEIFESKVDPLVRFFHIRDVGPGRWLRIHKFRDVDDARTRCTTEIEADFTDVAPSAIGDKPPLIFASFDIECVSGTGDFPLEYKEEDKIIQIGTTFKRFGEEPYLRTVVCIGDTDPSADIEILRCDSEAQLINTWIETVNRESSDVLVSYNGNQFDWKYISGRAELLTDEETGESLVCLDELGRLPGGEVCERELSSAAYGDNKFFNLTTPGILQIDLIVYVRKEYKLDSYSLKNVAAKFLPGQEGKIDLPPHKIFEYFKEGTAAQRLLIA